MEIFDILYKVVCYFLIIVLLLSFLWWYFVDIPDNQEIEVNVLVCNENFFFSGYSCEDDNDCANKIIELDLPRFDFEDIIGSKVNTDGSFDLSPIQDKCFKCTDGSCYSSLTLEKRKIS